jgi:periplasmic copper chaperone A
MSRLLSNLSPVVAAALLFAGAQPVLAQPAPKAQTPHVMSAWVRLPAVTGRPAGGYFVAHGTALADALVAVTSPKAERVELHSMTNENGVMKMRREDSFALPAKGTLTFAPGGSHLMLFGLAADTKPGSKIPLTFRFESGATVTLDAEARAASAAVAPPAKASDPGHQH